MANSKSHSWPVIIVIIIILAIIGCCLPDDDSSSSSSYSSSSHSCVVCGNSGAKYYKSSVNGSTLSYGYYCSSCVSKRRAQGIQMTLQ